MKHKKIIIVSVISLITLILFNGLFFTWKISKSKQKYDIPKVYFIGDMEGMKSKSDDRNIKVEYDDGLKKVKCYASIKVQGSSSLMYDKKNYTIKLFKDESHKNKLYYDFGFGSQTKYCLKANWIDKTHARNIVSAKLGAELQKDSKRFVSSPNNGLIDGFPVEIYLNDEFLGLYTWNIPKDAWLWDLDEDDEKTTVVTFNSHNEQSQFKDIITNVEDALFDVEVGNYSEDLKDNVNRLILFIRDSTDDEFRQNFDKYLDKESSLNYVLMLYILNGVDNVDKNMMLVTYDQKLWYPSLYDLDTTFGTEWDGKNVIDYSFIPENGDSLLWNRFIDIFKDELTERYAYYRKANFSKEHIMSLFKEFKDKIPEHTWQAEREKWPDAPGYDYEQIEEYLDYKLPYLDELFGINIEESESII